MTDKIAWLYRVLQQNSGVTLIARSAVLATVLIFAFSAAPLAFAITDTVLVVLLIILNLIDSNFTRISWSRRDDLAYFVIGAICLLNFQISAWCLASGIALMFASALAPFTFRIGARLDLAGDHIPGVGRTYHPNFSAVLGILMPIAAIAAGWAGYGFWGIVATFLTYATLLLVIANGTIGVLRFLRREKVEREITESLSKQNPSFAFFFGTDASQLYQVEMWLPLLNRLNKPYFILTRSKSSFLALQSMTEVPIVYCRRFVDVEKVFVPSLKTILYVNTALNNMQMVRFPQFTHIMLNHGDSDKVASFSPTMRMFDKNFVAGQAAIDRFIEHDVQVFPEQFEIVGRPQLNSVEVESRKFSSLRESTVLYAPTWSGWVSDSQYSSLFQGEEILRILINKGFRVIFRSHPMTNKNPELMAVKRRMIEILEHENEQGHHHLFGPAAESELSIIDCFNQSDMLITDVSSVPSDYLYSLKPSIMMNVSSSAETFAEEFPLSRASYVVTVENGSVSSLNGTLDLIQSDDPMQQTRVELKKYYLSQAPEGKEYDELFTGTLEKYI
ncbi:MAG: CDP-glycerol glycerophosphotransferase family protein [Bifidobacteriaceae bacterium]|jgi:hypothetical protein|nr:CDP-glycerol glycerophosphotransferase family protein [Bifidobacteriaceae bacterium]